MFLYLTDCNGTITVVNPRNQDEETFYVLIKTS